MPAATRARKTATSPPVPFIAPQLATLVDAAPVGSAWMHETKYDGYRIQVHVFDAKTILYSRNALDWSDKFPGIRDELTAAIGDRPVVLDGEIIVGSKSRHSFHALQTALSDKETGKAVLFVFDLLFDNGVDLRPRPLAERREALEALFGAMPAASRVQLSNVLRGTAAAALEKACARDQEGIISKLKHAPYNSGRGHGWVKVKCAKRQEFVVIGYSEPKGSRAGLGALLLGVYDEQAALRYAGRVGTGFKSDELLKLRATLGKLEVKHTPLDTVADMAPVREAGRVQWVRPKLVAEVSFTEWTDEGLLRHPVFQGLRVDKKPTDVVREGA